MVQSILVMKSQQKQNKERADYLTSLSIYNEADDTTLHFRMESTHCMKYWNSYLTNITVIYCCDMCQIIIDILSFPNYLNLLQVIEIENDYC